MGDAVSIGDESLEVSLPLWAPEEAYYRRFRAAVNTSVAGGCLTPIHRNVNSLGVPETTWKPER